jgi:signal transduction histidine kinase
MERGALAGIAALRWLAWGWMAIVLLVADDPLVHPLGAISLAAIALAWTALATFALRVAPDVLLTRRAVLVELAIGFALLAGDGWVYADGHVFRASQSFGSVWPLAGVLSAGLVLGPIGGAAGGVVLGIGRLLSALLNGVDEWTGDQVLSLTSTAVLYVLAGIVAGYASMQLREAETRVSIVRAREEVARTLHDGVLQTLAIVQRRSDDDDLVRLARDQERELRAFLFGSAQPSDANLGVALLREAGRFEHRFGGQVDVVVADDLERLTAEEIDAVAGAVGEAMTNAGKHGSASHVTVYAEPDEPRRLFCSVKDDGSGFDETTVKPGAGLSRSIRGRVEAVGGRVEIDGRPGRGAEVRLWLP